MNPTMDTPMRAVSLLVLLAVVSFPSVACAQEIPYTLRGLTSYKPGHGIREGSPCKLDINLLPVGEACASSPYSCVVTRTPSKTSAYYRGVCNSSYALGPHCAFLSQPYAVGTIGIRNNPACHRCDCNNHPENAEVIAEATAAAFDKISAYGLLSAGLQSTILNTMGVNTARCDCQVIGPCFVDREGKIVPGESGKGVACPAKQSRCVIQEVGGGGVDEAGRPLDVGTCEPAGEMNTCMVAGDGWGPKYYARGVQGVPDALDACKRCTCSDSNEVAPCVPVPKCSGRSGGGSSTDDDDAAAARAAAGAAASGDVYVDVGSKAGVRVSDGSRV
eukprot:TRINITY_DN10934_c0_g1_i1.p1 TRINITY_DN10934_c0_g1~~TRINITY_DN10934_c0_g1_i1.p1  ORF type:complete len:332 (-),score=-28.65 TRINITY_DN10934_c0_g1_i1:47-1042(-)